MFGIITEPDTILARCENWTHEMAKALFVKGCSENQKGPAVPVLDSHLWAALFKWGFFVPGRQANDRVAGAVHVPEARKAWSNAASVLMWAASDADGYCSARTARRLRCNSRSLAHKRAKPKCDMAV